MAKSSPDYVLGHGDRELDRLSLQARMFEPFTRQLFLDAGIAPGMRVLDVGSGSGDVAMLAAELVGPEGEVVGLDRAADAVERATARAAARDLANVRFLCTDLLEHDPGPSFDAIVGRLVLMYLPDPVAAIQALSRALRLGGIVAFQEFDMSVIRTRPHVPLLDKCAGWVLGTFARAGIETEMGPRLFDTFVRAGLPSPRMRIDGSMGGGPDFEGALILVEVIRSLLPQIERLGVATAADVDIDTLAARTCADLEAAGAVLTLPLLIGAWSRSSA